MANSITASTFSPYSNTLLVDQTQTGSFPAAGATGSTAPLLFPNIGWPEVGSFTVTVYNTALTNTSGSATIGLYLQDSNDGVTYTNVATFAQPLCSTVDGGALSAPAASTQVLLTPASKPYVRAIAIVPTGGATAGGITGSFGIYSAI